jgi:diaminohydroxyphosphoribosylaminopyrimidine deaminase / 5-amino-6-(5-phosphoribosylamino)uracil reductase
METALKIAFRQMGMTSPNPPVGAVIARDGAVIATGGTGPCGTCHAETDALSRAEGKCAGAEMYVTLEPCSHFGRTPPCTEAIIRAGIRRVYIPALDPNPLVSGKGVAGLRDAGIEVVLMEEMAGPAIDLLRPFKKYILRHRPFILSKSAVTLDGRIAAKGGDSRWISSDHSRYIMHRIRAKVDAIIVGKTTFMHDNPSLNVRLGSFDPAVAAWFREHEPAMAGRQNFLIRSLMTGEIDEPRAPLRIVIGLPRDIDRSSSLFADGNYIFFERREAADRIAREGGIPGWLNLHVVDASSPREEILAIQEELHRRGVMFVLLEGGGRLAGSFLDAGEIDQFLYIITPKVAGDGVPSLAARGVESISDALVLKDVTMVPVLDDLLYCGYREPYHFEML